MPPRTPNPPPLDPRLEVPFWRSAAFAWGLMAALILTGFILTNWLQKVNSRQQAEWRLRADRSLSALATRLGETVAANTREGAVPGERAPVILWLGTIEEYRESTPTDGSPPTTSVILRDASLLAGTPLKDESASRLVISGKHFTFPGPMPRPGETWLISAWREDNRAVIHTATRTNIR